MNILERFLKYVTIDTFSDSTKECIPSTKGQKVLASILVQELKELGIETKYDEEHGYVYGFLPKNIDAPSLGFISHLDTCEDAKGEVVPNIIPDYDGLDIHLLNDITIKTRDYPDLKNHIHKTLITSNGKSLLGADDKAGIAEIMNMLEYFANTDEAHGDIYVCFTPDEEIGRSTDYFSFENFKANFAYTVDGSSLGEICYENFNACDVNIKIEGIPSHYGTAKGVMVNALNIANMIHDLVPPEYPENTEKKEGYFCLHRLSGTPTCAQMTYVIRDFDKDGFQGRKDLLIDIADIMQKKYGISITTEVVDSYYNMKEVIDNNFHLVLNARSGMSKLNVTPIEKPIRGGTDGTSLSFRGLPCPNLGTGGHNFHSILEYIALEDMEKCSEILIAIVREYAKNKEAEIKKTRTK